MTTLEELKKKMKYNSWLLNEKLVSNNFNLLDEDVIELSRKIDSIHNDILKLSVI